MKKIIFILLLFFYAQPFLAEAVSFNDPATCAVDGGVFYICSGEFDSGDSCAGTTFRPKLFGHSRVWAYSGDTFNFDDNTYICKNGVFESLGVSGVLFGNPATCAVRFVKAKDVFYICSGNVDGDNPCAGVNYNSAIGDTRIWMNAGDIENIGGVNYICENGILQQTVSGTDGYVWGDNNWCAVRNRSLNKDFHLCGDDGTGSGLECHKRSYTAGVGDSRNFYKNNDVATIGDESFTCCIASGKSTGTFKDTKSLVNVSTTVQLENGSCTYNKKKNVCGNIVEDNPCKVPTNCNSGYVLIGGKCISATVQSSSASSVSSGSANNCPTTDTQGLDRDGICQKCSGTTPKWDKTQRKCVAKSSTSASSGSATHSTTSSNSSSSTQQSQPSGPTEVTREDMEKCWFCRMKDAFYECVKSKGNPENNHYKKDCNLD